MSLDLEWGNLSKSLLNSNNEPLMICHMLQLIKKSNNSIERLRALLGTLDQTSDMPDKEDTYLRNIIKGLILLLSEPEIDSNDDRVKNAAELLSIS